MSIQDEIKTLADEMGTDYSQLADMVAKNVRQMAHHEERDLKADVADMVRNELGIDGSDDEIVSGVVNFVEDYSSEDGGWTVGDRKDISFVD